MKDGFLRAACATPKIKVADCAHNAKAIIAQAKEAAGNGASLIVFPELCITGYTCSDLFLQQSLLVSAEKALAEIIRETKELDAVIIVGLPVRANSALYNCAAVLCKGELLAFVPKTHIPNYSEFYEMRHFTPADKDSKAGKNTPQLGHYTNFGFVYFGTDLIFQCREMPEFKFGVEICEDLWTPEPPSEKLAKNGATIIANLSASDEVIGKADYRRMLVKSTSARLLSAYIYTSAGLGESTTDLVFSGHNLICENGALLSESKRFTTGITYADIDLQKLEYERRHSNTFVGEHEYQYRLFSLPLKELKLSRHISKTPFVPESKINLDERCEEILTIQAAGLATRIEHTNAKSIVIGLSGGLDSTLALIVAVHAMDMLGRDRKDIIAVTMPCFGTTKRTKSNAEILTESYGVIFQDINISKAVTQHFEDIGQDPENFDVTYENGQARERTQVLMDIANKNGGFVIGTGDLSELALGWATYNGDHMSMYAVNASIPKTLVRHLTAYEADHTEGSLKAALLDILDTPVSPELLPPKDGEIAQKTEDLVGPYELHDFFLYYFVRFGFTADKIFRMAKIAFEGTYDDETIQKWLQTFIRRFFSQQFKRSCLPDGPKVGTVTLSPRGDWRMPSDASSAMFMPD
ncbi:MAG: NAD(+) synthase [Clostridia bacterium]|nr:NAD(+) synthase [Clostridia bacterium]